MGNNEVAVEVAGEEVKRTNKRAPSTLLYNYSEIDVKGISRTRASAAAAPSATHVHSTTKEFMMIIRGSTSLACATKERGTWEKPNIPHSRTAACNNNNNNNNNTPSRESSIGSEGSSALAAFAIAGLAGWKARLDRAGFIAKERGASVCRRAVPVVNSATRTVNPATNEPVTPTDFPRPKTIKDTANFLEAQALSRKFLQEGSVLKPADKRRVAIIGGGLSGLACAKYLADAGHEPILLEARDTLGGKVSAWKDKDGDWVETGLHIFFGAYANIMNLFAELKIEERLQWKRHQMTFAMQELPGEFTTFDFNPQLPAPLNFLVAILENQKMLTLSEKLQAAAALFPLLFKGQDFVNDQDELSVTDFMKAYGMPDRITEEVFISMAKALAFMNPDTLSMAVVLTAMDRFLQETDGLQMAFLDGNQPDRLCEPMKQHIEKAGGQVLLNQAIDKIVVGQDGAVQHLLMRSGEIVEADEYISAMPCDVLRRMLPREWSTMPFFRQIDELEGVPVINLHLWFDRKLLNVDHLCFSRSPLLSVYADMSTCCKEYNDPDRSMLELVFAPCSEGAGSREEWLKKSDSEIVAAAMKELERLFPTEIGKHLPDGGAQLRKSAVVRVPRSVYAATPGRNKYRPSQQTPIRNFTLAGDFTDQKFLGSMEGAVLAGKLAAEVVVDRAVGRLWHRGGWKRPLPEVVERTHREHSKPKDPVGVKGSSAIAFGGGAVLPSDS